MYNSVLCFVYETYSEGGSFTLDDNNTDGHTLQVGRPLRSLLLTLSPLILSLFTVLYSGCAFFFFFLVWVWTNTSLFTKIPSTTFKKVIEYKGKRRKNSLNKILLSQTVQQSKTTVDHG